MLVGVVRYKHFTLSQHEELTARHATFKCIRGKRREKGARPPFFWALPRCLLEDVDIFGPLWDVKASYVEIYMERIRDLLHPVAANATPGKQRPQTQQSGAFNSQNLRIRHDKKGRGL